MSTFTVSLVASDGSDESELPVVLRRSRQMRDGLLPRQMTAAPPSPPYMSQQIENGALGKEALKVGPRRGVVHNLEFKHSGTVNGFKFAEDKKAGLLAHKRIPASFTAVTMDNIFHKEGSEVLNNVGGSLPSNTASRVAPGVQLFRPRIIRCCGGI